MALNFPLNPEDQKIYIDPTSGLKYIFNKSIGGWETAIQPPVIITTDGNPPDISIDGFLWWNGQDRILYVLRGGTWAPVSSDSVSTATKVTVDSVPPQNSLQGDLWWDNVSLNLYIYYVDADSSQWVIAAPNVGGGSGTTIHTGPSAPPNGIEGDMWFNTINNTIYVYHFGQWLASSTAVAGVQSVTGLSPVYTSGTSEVTIGVSEGDTTKPGVLRLANQPEVNTLSNANVALSPNRLAVGIDYYLPQATTTRKGVAEIANETEAVQQTDNEKMITPATLGVALAASGNPPGTIIAFAGTTAPVGYLICDGSIVQDAPAQTIQGITGDFRTLRGVLGTSFSPNNTDVTLPDLRGEFLRGWRADKPGVDSGRELGSFQGQSIQSHFHSGPAGPADTSISGQIYGGGNRLGESGIYETNATGDLETRPRNVAVLYCITY